MKKTSPAKQAQTIAELREELAQSLQRENVTSDILRMIARMPHDLQSVMDSIAENAARLCDAEDAIIFRVEGDVQHRLAVYGVMPTSSAVGVRKISRGTPVGRAVIDRETIHVFDIADELETEFLEYRTIQQATGTRTCLNTPLLHDGMALGVIHIRRTEVRPFTDRQIKLLETFADQAVIAIENARLFQELTRKTTELESSNSEVREALEQQTATSDILRVIASSPTNLQPVLDIMAENAARLCEADDAQILRLDGDVLRRVASFGSRQTAETRPVTREIVAGRAVIDRQTVQVHDIHAAEEQGFKRSFAFGLGESRTLLAVPLLREGESIGAILIRRFQVRPFLDSQIALLKTFADQAVIAIENVRLFQQLKEALEQQTATSEILGVIASSPTDIQPVLDAVAQSAAQLCESYDAVIHRVDGDHMQRVAHFGPVPVAEGRRRISRGFPMGRAIVDAQTIHVHDVLAEIDNEFPDAKGLQQQTGTRTVLATPLIRDGVAIGVINTRRTEVRPFTERQIALLKTFAAQAVIAIENVRLFNELQERNRDLTEALEQQTATSDVLRVISSSPTDVQPVFDAIVQSAARLCEASFGVVHRFDGQVLTFDAHHNMTPDQIEQTKQRFPTPVTRASASGRAILDRQTVQIEDVRADPEYRAFGAQQALNYRTVLAVPLLRGGSPIGTLGMWRREIKPFTENQINLVKTFADQAVIAIENVRLFQELKESLEQQTATSEILGAIASSPTDLEPVLKTITERATRVCGAEDGVLRLVDGNVLRLAAHYGSIPHVAVERPINRKSPPGRAVVDQAIIHHEDVDQLIESEYPEMLETRRQIVARTFLAVPLICEGVTLGVIHFRRLEVRPFSDKQIALLKTFADQAVIAIENVRLFKEIQDRNAELREALEHQTATAEVLGIISRSPTDVQPVLDAIVESAARVCGIDDVVLRLQDGNAMVCRAHFGPLVINRVEISIHEPQFDWMREHGTLHIPDASDQTDSRMAVTGGWRTFLVVPLRQHSELIGGLFARRTEVRPFTPAQIKLLETFADQAVIAIENVRLFEH